MRILWLYNTVWRDMIRVIKNIDIDDRYFFLKTEGSIEAKAGQFYMLRAWDNYPTLSRPISIYNVSDGLEFLIEERGEGTNLLRRLKEGDELKAYGPYGNSFDIDVKKVALVGGGVGTAPMYLTAKRIKEKNKNAEVKLYLGLDETTRLDEMFYDLKDLGVEIFVKRGGFITDIIDFKEEKLIYACGPEAMLENITKLSLKEGSICYVSLDTKMACGVGACLGCTCKTKNGNKRTCKEGPIFLGSDIYE